MSKTVTARTTPKRVQIAGDLSTSAFTTLARATYHQVGLYGMREILRHIEAACVAEIPPDGETSEETLYRQTAALEIGLTGKGLNG